MLATGRCRHPSTGTARRVALADHIAEPEIVSVEFLVDPPREYGRPGPVWQGNFEDGEGTRTYVSPATGQVVTHRNDRWRLFDFLWMLHIMDYEERDNFNHPLIISAAAWPYSPCLPAIAFCSSTYAEPYRAVARRTGPPLPHSSRSPQQRYLRVSGRRISG